MQERDYTYGFTLAGAVTLTFDDGTNPNQWTEEERRRRLAPHILNLLTNGCRGEAEEIARLIDRTELICEGDGPPEEPCICMQTGRGSGADPDCAACDGTGIAPPGREEREEVRVRYYNCARCERNFEVPASDAGRCPTCGGTETFHYADG